MSDVSDTVERIEGLGGRLALNEGRICYRIPKGKPQIHSLLVELKHRREEVVGLLRRRDTVWPAASQKMVCQFGHSVARLYPFLQSRVRTPLGTGRLLQVFRDRAEVLLDGRDRSLFLSPDSVWPEKIM